MKLLFTGFRFSIPYISAYK